MIGLLLASIFGIRAAAQTPTADDHSIVYVVGRTECAVPSSLPASVSSKGGVGNLVVKPRPGFSLTVTDYDWRGAVALGMTPSKYLKEALDPAGYDHFSVPEPLASSTFQGYPAWTYAISHRITDHHDSDRSVQIVERELVVRRRWGFVIVNLTDNDTFFRDDIPYFDSLVKGMKLKPEPPGNPRIAALLLAAVILGAVAFGVKRLRAQAKA